MKTIKLNNGIEMPILGFGTFHIEDIKEAEKAVKEALQMGYRLIDTAQIYLNEEGVGNGIIASGVKREEIFLTTKIWVENTSYEGVMESFKGSLKRLKTDYVDLLLIHIPYNDVYGAWRAMEELLAYKKVRAIGVSNFSSARLIDLTYFNKIKPAVNQIEINPFFQEKEEIKVLQKHGVVPEAWAPLAQVREDILQNPVLVKIAKKHKKTVAQIILNWITSQNVVAIVKSVHPERMKENMEIFDFTLDGEDLKDIEALDLGKSQIIDQTDPEIAIKLSSWKLPDNLK